MIFQRYSTLNTLTVTAWLTLCLTTQLVSSQSEIVATTENVVSDPNMLNTTTMLPLEPMDSNEIDNGKRLISDRDWNKLAEILKVNRSKLPQLKKIGRKLDSLFNRVQQNRGKINPEILVQEFLPDPMRIKDIPVEKSEGFFSSYTGRFTNITMHGVRNLRIQSIRVNVGKFNAKILINIPSIYLDGQYNLNGQVSFVNIEGEGNFRFNISELDIDAYGNLNRTSDGHLQIGNIELDVNPGDMNIELENFSVFGSEIIANTIIGTMSDLIFTTVKSTVLDKTSNKIRLLINKRLEKIPIDIIKPTSETLFDDLVAFAANKIQDKVEPLKLPPIHRELAFKLLVLQLNATVDVTEGKLHGLTTFARTGDIFITYEDEEALIEAEVGFKNLTGTYRWKLNVLGKGPSGSASLAIRKVSTYLRIRQQLKRGSVPKLERVRVEEIDHVWLDMNGLGVWDYLLEMIINTVSNAFRFSIGNLIASTVTKVVQESLDNAQISFIP